MTGQQLEEKWKDIKLPKRAKYSYQRIDTHCVPELQLGISDNGNRCLILKLKYDLKFKFYEEEKENIKTYYYKSERSLVLELIDPFYNRFFGDLIISLYQLIKDIANEDESTRLFIETVRFWADFLKAKRSHLPSLEVIQGLYGELVYIEYLIDNSRCPINQILKSWRGPFKSNHDFHFLDKNVEVKTKSANNHIVQIASEYQLEPEPGKDLELAVVSVDLLNNNGENLKTIIDRIRSKTLKLGGSVSIIDDALSEMKLTFLNVIDYDFIQFKPTLIEVYDCKKADFPKIIRSEINQAACNISYNLSLLGINNNLLVSKIIFT